MPHCPSSRWGIRWKWTASASLWVSPSEASPWRGPWSRSSSRIRQPGQNPPSGGRPGVSGRGDDRLTPARREKSLRQPDGSDPQSGQRRDHRGVRHRTLRHRLIEVQRAKAGRTSRPSRPAKLHLPICQTTHSYTFTPL